MKERPGEVVRLFVGADQDAPKLGTLITADNKDVMVLEVGTKMQRHHPRTLGGIPFVLTAPGGETLHSEVQVRTDFWRPV
jgi:hypothetical protein